MKIPVVPGAHPRCTALMSAARSMAGGRGSQSVGGVPCAGSTSMSESVAGLIMTLIGGLALLIFTTLCFGPGEVVGLGGTFLEVGDMTTCALWP